MRYPKKEKIISLVNKVNSSEKIGTEGLLPLTFTDDGWRLVFGKSLEFYYFCSAGRKLLQLAEYDYDAKGFYYWVQVSDAPSGVTTPAMRAKYL
jgi:hypothetical protein